MKCCKFDLRQLLFLSVLLFAVFCNCKPSYPSEDEIVVLAVNDLHGDIGTVPKIAALAGEYREHCAATLLLSAGDLFIGNAYSDCYPAKGYPIIDMMSAAGLDASTLGNHDFDFGSDTLAQRMREAGFPFLCANVSGFDIAVQPLPYKIFELNGRKVAVLGLIVCEPATGAPPTSMSNVRGLTFYNPVKTALKYRSLRDSCDLFIALSHMGFEKDKELALLMPELDWIIGGHSHDLLDKPEFVNGVGISQNGKNNRISVLVFNLSQKTADGRATVRFSSLSIAKLEKEDGRCLALYEKYSSQSPLNYTIGAVAFPYKGKEVLGYLMADALTALDGVDMAVVNPGGVRLGKLPEGGLSAKTACDLDPFGNKVMLVEMKAADIVSLIKEEYGKSGGFLLPSGFTYRVAESALGRGIDRVELFYPDGNPIPEGDNFRVAMNNYIVENYRFTSQSRPFDTGVFATPNLIDYIQSQEVIKPDKKSRIRINASL